MCVALAVGCSKPGEDPTDKPSGSPSGKPAASAGGAAQESSPLRLLAKATVSFNLVGMGGDGAAIAGGAGLSIEEGKLAERPGLERGLTNPKWSERQWLGSSRELMVFAGKRDPESLWKGDEMITGDSKAIGADRTVYRTFKKNAWIQTAAVKDGEKSAGIGRFLGRVVSPILMDGGKDYRFILVAGKTGIALPRPGTAPKKENEAEPSAEVAAPSEALLPPPGGSPRPVLPDSGVRPRIPADAGARPTASTAPPAKPPAKPAPPASAKPPSPPAEKPDPAGTGAAAKAADKDPSLPWPTDQSCVTRLVPHAFDGLESGESMLVGGTCPDSEQFWVEHWAAKSRASTYERLPEGLKGPVAIAITGEGSGYVAGLGSQYLAFGQSGKWEKVKLPTDGAITQLASSPGGKLWLIVGGKVFSREGTGPFEQLNLGDCKAATHVLPTDGDAPFVACGTELFGPPDAAPKGVVEVGKGATSLCKTPYVTVRADVDRSKRYPEDVKKVKESGVEAELVFGHRGMEGKKLLEAKVADMAAARKLAKAISSAGITCGEPRDVQKL